MERIKHAIEKARSGEIGGITTPISSRTGLRAADSGERLSINASKSAASTASAVHVSYRQTAVVSLDPMHLERHRVVAHQKNHPASWAFDVLRTQVLQKMQENGWRTLAVTSPTVASGKTLVSINLGISIAQQTNRTSLLVDFDLRRPSIARVLGLDRPQSLNDVLAGHADIADVLINPGIDRFVVLPTNSPVEGASEVLSSPRVGQLLGELRSRYSDRIVIVDLPPILAADDVMSLLPQIDCVLLVVASGVSNKVEIDETMTRLSKANLLGVVLNKDEAPVRASYY